MKIKGIVAKPGVRNSNGRMYTAQCLHDAVEKFQPHVQNRTALAFIRDAQTTNLLSVAGLLTSLECGTESVFGEVELLGTEQGKFLFELLDAKVSLTVELEGRVLESEEVGMGFANKVSKFDITHVSISLRSPETK